MTREEAKAKAGKTIDDLADKINQLKAKKDEVQNNVTDTYSEVLDQLELEKEQLQKKYEDFANDDKWEEARDSFAQAGQSIKDGLSSIASLFKS